MKCCGELARMGVEVINPHKLGICRLWKILWETWQAFLGSFANIRVIDACSRVAAL